MKAPVQLNTRVRPEIAKDVQSVTDRCGMSARQIVEDALEFYLGKSDASLVERRAFVVKAFTAPAKRAA